MLHVDGSSPLLVVDKDGVCLECIEFQEVIKYIVDVVVNVMDAFIILVCEMDVC